MGLEIPSGIASVVYELETRERRFRTVFESASDAIVIFDDHRRVLEANSAAAELFGCPSAELKGRQLDAFCPDRAGAESPWGAMGAANQTRKEFEITRRDGERRTVETNVTSDFVVGQHVGVVRDVTDQYRRKAELNHAQQLEAIGRLAGGIAHEFNNLLAVITGFAALLEATVSGDADGEDSVTEIKRAANRAVKLVHGLLAFSKQETFDLRPVDLHALIRRTSGALQELLGPQIRIDERLDASRGWVETDAYHLEHALQQLCLNARDAMPDGGMLAITTSDEDEEVQLSVQDSGTGMDAVTLERAFEPFFTTKPLGAGTGLGLSTVYGIVAQSGGRITAESEPGKGTTVHLCLRSAEPVADLAGGYDRYVGYDRYAERGCAWPSSSKGDERQFVPGTHRTRRT